MPERWKTNAIAIVGAKEHNLKNISLNIPRDRFVVFTGLSGSGKSSLAFDIVYAEGQRRYIDSLVRLRAPVSRSHGAAQRRLCRRHPADRRHRTTAQPGRQKIDRRDGDGDLSLLAPALFEDRQTALRPVRPANSLVVAQPDPRPYRPLLPRQRSLDLEPHRARPQRFSQRSDRRRAPAGLSPRAHRRQARGSARAGADQRLGALQRTQHRHRHRQSQSRRPRGRS